MPRGWHHPRVQVPEQLELMSRAARSCTLMQPLGALAEHCLARAGAAAAVTEGEATNPGAPQAGARASKRLGHSRCMTQLRGGEFCCTALPCETDEQINPNSAKYKQ